MPFTMISYQLVYSIVLLLSCLQFFASSLRFSSKLSMAVQQVNNFKKIPVTVLSGFLGSGKTTLLQHILTRNSDNNKKYAVIVNDMSELNIDGALIQPFIQNKEEKMIEMSNGCICCTLREDLLHEIKRISLENKYDHLIIESTGISEPLPVAETFTFDFNELKDSNNDHEFISKTPNQLNDSDNDNELISHTPELLSDYAEIDSMVTLVDAVNFLNDINEAEDLSSRNLQADENDTRTITDLLVSQIEFASVIMINKCDLVTRDQIDEIKSFVRSLNADAIIHETIKSNIGIDEIIGSNTYNYEKVSQSASWIQAMNENSRFTHRSESDEYGITSFIYRARRPFHPTRLLSFINDSFQTISKIYRSKGFFWIANKPDEMVIWSQAGGLFQFSYGGLWWIDTNREEWPDDKDTIDQIMLDWDENTGDRRQEIVFIGKNLEQQKIINILNDCLLSDNEYNDGKESWINYDNVFPIS